MLYSTSPLTTPTTLKTSLKSMALAITLLTVAGCDDASQTQQTDVKPGEVLVSPAPEAERIALATQVKVRFSDESIIAGGTELLTITLNGEPVEGQVLYSELEQQVTFLPTEPLAPNSRYMVMLEETTLADGTVTPAKDWYFETTDGVGLTPQWVLDSCMTDDDIEHLARVNTMRSQGECGGDSYPSAQPLIWHCDVAFVAAEHAADLVRMGEISAYGSDGKNPAERLSAATDIHWRGVAENSFSTPGGEVHSGSISALALTKAAESAEHCANLLNPELSHFGIASVEAQSGGEIWVQLLVAQ